MAPRIFHNREYPKDGNPHPKTIRTIAYELDIQKGELVYGATVFKRIDSKDKWDRKDHIARSLERFNEDPVTVVFEPPSKGWVPDWYDYRRREETILKCLFLFGVKDGHHVFNSKFSHWFDETERPSPPQSLTSWLKQPLTAEETKLMFMLFGIASYLVMLSEFMARFR